MPTTPSWPDDGRLGSDDTSFEQAAREAVEDLLVTEDLENRAWIARERLRWGVAAGVWILAFLVFFRGAGSAVPEGVLSALILGAIAAKMAGIRAQETLMGLRRRPAV